MAIRKGYIVSEQTKNKIRNAIMQPHILAKLRQVNLGAKNNQWKGDKVKYVALHIWVRARLKPPKKCPNCKRKVPLDLANKGTYNRKLSNWEYLCRRCHMVKDGRILGKKTRKAVVQFDLLGNQISAYVSIREAARVLDLGENSIRNNLKGRSNSGGGYIWRYFEEKGYPQLA